MNGATSQVHPSRLKQFVSCLKIEQNLAAGYAGCLGLPFPRRGGGRGHSKGLSSYPSIHQLGRVSESAPVCFQGRPKGWGWGLETSKRAGTGRWTMGIAWEGERASSGCPSVGFPWTPPPAPSHSALGAQGAHRRCVQNICMFLK